MGGFPQRPIRRIEGGGAGVGGQPHPRPSAAVPARSVLVRSDGPVTALVSRGSEVVWRTRGVGRGPEGGTLGRSGAMVSARLMDGAQAHADAVGTATCGARAHHRNDIVWR